MSKSRTVLPYLVSAWPVLSAASAFAAEPSPWSVSGQWGFGVTRTDNGLETPSGARPDIWLAPELAVALKYKASPTLSLSAGMDESVQLYGHLLDAGFTKPFPYVAASRDFGTWNLTGKIAQEFAYDQRFDAAPVKRLTASAILSHDFVLTTALKLAFQARYKRAWSDFGSLPRMASPFTKPRSGRATTLENGALGSPARSPIRSMTRARRRPATCWAMWISTFPIR